MLEVQCIMANGHVDPPLTDRHTHTTENIVFLQLRWRTIKICNVTGTLFGDSTVSVSFHFFAYLARCSLCASSTNRFSGSIVRLGIADLIYCVSQISQTPSFNKNPSCWFAE